MFRVTAVACRSMAGLEHPAGFGAAGTALEDDLGAFGAADVEVVGDQGLEERPGVTGGGEHQGAGDLDLAHGQLPPEPGRLVSSGERDRQPRHPPGEEHADGAGLQPVADGLQAVRVAGGGEAVGQLGESDPGLDRLALGPFVPVDPDLDRVGEIGADLDERLPNSASHR